MLKEKGIKKLTAVLFVFFLFMGFWKSGSYNEIQKIADYLKQDMDQQETDDLVTINMLEKEFANQIWNRKKLINLNGKIARRLHMQGFYSDYGMYVIDGNYVVSPASYTTTDYEYSQTLGLKQFLDENGIHFLYVNEPVKYMDDSIFRKNFGVESYSNRNADMFLARIREEEIPAIDLRNNINSEGRNVKDLFYRTDHHWTTRAGLWATQIIAGGLNEYCGYAIDTSIYDESNYSMTEWKECWLGEQGRKLGVTYVGMEDYTEIKPNFQTNYTFKTSEEGEEGTFDDFIDEEMYYSDNDLFENSWHYSYEQKNCINNDVAYGKVLMLGDSYAQVTQPFLSLGVHEVDSLILRNCNDSFDLKDYIIENGYDTVVICYAQFMIGAHDNPSSANYRMFSFE